MDLGVEVLMDKLWELAEAGDLGIDRAFERARVVLVVVPGVDQDDFWIRDPRVPVCGIDLLPYYLGCINILSDAEEGWFHLDLGAVEHMRRCIAAFGFEIVESGMGSDHFEDLVDAGF